MKPRLLFAIVALFIGILIQTTPLLAQESKSGLELLEQLAGEKFLAEFFKDFFIDLGITIEETGEQLTVKHLGDHFMVEKGLDEEQVDYVLPLKMVNVTNLLSHAEDGKINEDEAYQIVAVLFTPVTAMTLSNPIMMKQIPRWMNNIENHIHVYLYNSDKADYVAHTLIYINKAWIVIPGLHGTPKRVYKLDMQHALAYQQKVFEAIQTNERKTWKAFKRWYLQWRKEVSVQN